MTTALAPTRQVDATQPTVADPATGRSLVSPELFARLTNRIVADEQINPTLAERIMSQALVFLKACGDNTGTPLSPSPLVDIGWHTFVLYTRDYADFCERVAGRFIHHAPTDDGADHGDPAEIHTRTLDAIRAAGFTPDQDLWPSVAGDCNSRCTQCHARCTDSPQ